MWRKENGRKHGAETKRCIQRHLDTYTQISFPLSFSYFFSLEALILKKCSHPITPKMYACMCVCMCVCLPCLSEVLQCYCIFLASGKMSSCYSSICFSINQISNSSKSQIDSNLYRMVFNNNITSFRLSLSVSLNFIFEHVALHVVIFWPSLDWWHNRCIYINNK